MTQYSARKPTRVRNYDYANGTFFITMCLEDMRVMRFGEILDGEMVLTQAGEMIAQQWETNIERHPGSLLDAWVVMPNHIHAIVSVGTDS